MEKPEIISIRPKILIGILREMSLKKDSTSQIWREFMPRRKEIQDRIDGRFYSVQIFANPKDVLNFDNETIFQKGATIEVTGSSSIPDSMQSINLEAGLYAMFRHKGTFSDFVDNTRYIFQNWLPLSEYQLDDRIHFSVMDDRYLGDHPDSVEEIWIPVSPQ